MKKLLLLLAGAAVLVGAAMLSLPGLAQQTITGNGAPSGAHFELNIIGVSNPKTQPLTGGDRHTIFVGLGTKKQDVITNIYLTQGGFSVCDGNGFDTATDCTGNTVASSGAVFQLPCDLSTDVCSGGQSQAYTVWARALGKPGGQSTLTTCATDLLGVPICSTSSVLLVRGHGQQTFKDVTKELTTINTTLGTISLFETGFLNFFWQYDNNGLRLAQVRFYPQ
ncbi:MAG: hypothetical protein AUH66_00710 [Acidobacteria bacterium 13_1_40CM_4_57_6]|nr:MAG: hypothetical protein AUH66_00710 [Acidobacteria bacterium 13_1_40CM_4_57_6]